MFTGIVKSLALIQGSEITEAGFRFWIQSEALTDVELGASVALSGICLTASALSDGLVAFDVIQETRALTTASSWVEGTWLNCERSLRASDEIGGHFVLGHVDGIAEVVSKSANNEMTFRTTSEIGNQLVLKGSVTIEGVSLTLTHVSDEEFSVALVPHTLTNTTFGTLRPNNRVNVEIDVLSKLVAHHITKSRQGVTN